MTAAIMTSVYNALRVALPAVPVRRSWPQVPPAMPGCTFHLLQWLRQDDGSALCSIAVQLRVPLPLDGDTYAATAVTAMAGIGFQLQSARDGQEEETGFFLRSLVFASLFNIPEPELPPVLTPMQLRVYDDAAAAWLALAETVKITFKPATRDAIDLSTISQYGSIPSYQFGPMDFGSVTITAGYFGTNAVISLLRSAFLYGTDVRFAVRYQSDVWKGTYALVTAFHYSPLGLEVSLRLRNLFEV